MNAMHHSIHPAPSADRFDWGAQIRLGLVLSLVAVIVTVGLAGRVAEPVLIVGLILVASVLAWRRVPAVAPGHIRRR